MALWRLRPQPCLVDGVVVRGEAAHLGHQGGLVDEERAIRHQQVIPGIVHLWAHASKHRCIRSSGKWPGCLHVRNRMAGSTCSPVEVLKLAMGTVCSLLFSMTCSRVALVMYFPSIACGQCSINSLAKRHMPIMAGSKVRHAHAGCLAGRTSRLMYCSAAMESPAKTMLAAPSFCSSAYTEKLREPTGLKSYRSQVWGLHRHRKLSCALTNSSCSVPAAGLLWIAPRNAAS